LANILVTGGAGYIGSEVAAQLIDRGDNVIIVDNLSTGDVRRIPALAIFFKADFCDFKVISEIFGAFKISSVLHFAALKQARESAKYPELYWRNNVQDLVRFLDIVKEHEFQNLILSSSCSVYGNSGIVHATTPLKPVSTYGWTKLVSEQVCADFAIKFSWNFVALRYFNVIGASSRPFAGDYSSNCILPTLFRRHIAGEDFFILGRDFPTPDGTAIRDYIDVRDVARAHITALEVSESGVFGPLNVSSGKPSSVTEILEKFSEVSYETLKISLGEVNLADPAEVWGAPSLELLSAGWTAKIRIEDTILDHWRSFQRYF
jgi:UDP-glucose 4-epimerase